MRLRIAELRKVKQLTQEQLSARAGISRSYLANIETGKKIPNLTRLEQIAKGFGLGVSVTDLLVDPGRDLRLLRLMSALDRVSDQDYEAVIRHAEGLATVRPAQGSETDD